MSLSLYRTKEFGPSAKLSHSIAQYSNYGFITVLALAQRLGIPFLPMIWQASRGDLGRGGQSRVSQAFANLDTSFAFKRSVSIDEDSPFQAIVSEMIMLKQYEIDNHPYILTLEGICWEILGDDNQLQVWPVLVFEKSIHGDLFEFAKAGCGSSLSVQDKLKLCTDIGIAIRDMHLNSMYFFSYTNVDIFNYLSRYYPRRYQASKYPYIQRRPQLHCKTGRLWFLDWIPRGE